MAVPMVRPERYWLREISIPRCLCGRKAKYEKMNSRNAVVIVLCNKCAKPWK